MPMSTTSNTTPGNLNRLGGQMGRLSQAQRPAKEKNRALKSLEA